MQGNGELLAYGPCYPPKLGSVVPLIEHYISKEPWLQLIEPYDKYAGFRGCVLLIQPERQSPCCIIWILEGPHPSLKSTETSYLPIIIDAKELLGDEWYERLHSEGCTPDFFADAIRSVPLHRPLLFEDGTPIVTSLLPSVGTWTAASMEVTATVVKSRFLDRKVLELDISCVPGRSCKSVCESEHTHIKRVRRHLRSYLKPR
ncbi:hypothetical protein HD806DRAFT_475663 [Xylariaceae sp. AK1471]|nr:hypothetical protein HD806DRAFT_475663 [Xylariaceae sp. AK1471]